MNIKPHPPQGPITLDNKDRVAILMQLERTATDQMTEIKRDEISWLKIFLLFYGALIAWMVGRFFAPLSEADSAAPVTWMVGRFFSALSAAGKLDSSIANDGQLLSNALWFSYFLTAMFTFLFLHTRHSYFRVADRLHRIQQCLLLHDPTQWDGHTFFPVAHRSGKVSTIRQWRERAQPFSSFSTRLAYVVGANIGAESIAYRAFERIGMPQGGYFIVWVALSIGLAIGAYTWDYFHFKHRSSFDDLDVSQ
jgi:hypothetical protein